MKYLPPFNLQDISAYRSELMGWSILWIMMLHFTFTQVAPLGFVAQYGFAGVDVFMLVSGLGLFYSLEKDSNVMRFYKKRLLRIFPAYYLIGFIENLIATNDSIATFLFSHTTIGYWTGGEYADWFIPSIVALYLIAPLVKHAIDRKWFIMLGAVVVIVWGLAYYFTDKEALLDRSHFFLLYRIPAFIFGMVCAYWIKNEKPTRWFYFMLLAGLPFFIWLYPHHHEVYNFKYFSLVFLLPLFTLCFVLLSKYAKFASPLMRKMGQSSLEIYLIQGIFFTFVLEGKTSNYPCWHDTLTIIMIITSITLGITAHWGIEKLEIQKLFK